MGNKDHFCIACGSSTRINGGLYSCDRCGHTTRKDPPTIVYEDLSGRNLNAELLAEKIRSRLLYCGKYLEDCRSIVEIGAAEGDFLQAIRKSFKDITLIGVEPSLDKRRASMIGDVHIVSDVSMLDQGEKYDLVACFHVLEHIEDIGSFGRLLASRVSDCGYLVVEVPNKTGAEWKCFDSNKEHIHLFSRASLSLLLESWGFEVVSMDAGAFESYSYPDSLRATGRKSRSRDFELMRSGQWRHATPTYIWGTGETFEDSILPYMNSINVNALIDSGRAGEVFSGYTVVHPDRISFTECTESIFVIASDRHFISIRQEIVDRGGDANNIYTVDKYLNMLYVSFKNSGGLV